MLTTVIAVIITLVIAVPVSVICGINHHKKLEEEKIGDANTKARAIIDDALKNAEATKREASLAVKEETIKAKNEFEKETKERRAIGSAREAVSRTLKQMVQEGSVQIFRGGVKIMSRQKLYHKL